MTVGERALESLGIEEGWAGEALQTQFAPGRRVMPAPTPPEAQALQQLATVVRGRRTRSALQVARLEVEAASCLQRAVRGNVARKNRSALQVARLEAKAASRLQRVVRSNLRKTRHEQVASM